MKAKIKNAIIWFKNKILDNAISFDSVILVDGFTEQLKWLNVSTFNLELKGLSHKLNIHHYRTKEQYPNQDICKSAEPEIFYKEINLFQCVEYSVLVDLDISRHEFDHNDNVHRAALNRWCNYAVKVIDELDELFALKKPKVVVYFQGYFVESYIARVLCVKYHYACIALENTFHSEKMILECFSGISVNKNSAMLNFYKYYENVKFKFDRGIVKNYVQKLTESINKSKHADHTSSSLQYNWQKGRQRILFIGQCLTDSSLLFGINRNYSTTEVVRYLIDYAESTNSQLVVKLHPKENTGTNPLGRMYDKVTYQKLIASGIEDKNASKEYNHYHIDYDNSYSTDKLIIDADVIITFNSQAGFESLMQGKELILLGESFYDKIGITWNCPHLSMLSSAIQSILHEKICLNDLCKVEIFSYVYFELYCLEKNPDAICKKIKSLI
jgi:hypothetical protein